MEWFSTRVFLSGFSFDGTARYELGRQKIMSNIQGRKDISVTEIQPQYVRLKSCLASLVHGRVS